jgi:hypothetical protein
VVLENEVFERVQTCPELQHVPKVGELVNFLLASEVHHNVDTVRPNARDHVDREDPHMLVVHIIISLLWNFDDVGVQCSLFTTAATCRQSILWQDQCRK